MLAASRAIGENICPGRPRNGSTRTVQADQPLRRQCADPGSCGHRMAAPAECPTANTGLASRTASSASSASAMPGSDSPLGRRHLGEAVPGQIGGDHREPFGQQRRHARPGVGGGTGAVQQQGCRAAAHHLHMPAQSGRRARSGCWPGSASPTPSTSQTGRSEAGSSAPSCRCRSRATKRGALSGGVAARTAAESVAALGMRKRQVAGAHLDRDVAGRGCGRGEMSSTQRGQPGRPHPACGSQGVAFRRGSRPPLPSRATLARPSVSRIRIGVSPLRRIGSASARAASIPAASGVPPPPGKPGEAALGAHQRAGRRQQQLGAPCRERRAAPRGRGGRSSRPAATRRRPSPRPAGSGPPSRRRRRRRSWWCGCAA